MSSLSITDVKKLADLSALQLSEQEVKQLQADLDTILSYVDQLQAVDVSGVEPTYQVNQPATVTRSDKIIDYGIATEQLLSNAAEARDQQIVVPKVVG